MKRLFLFIATAIALTSFTACNDNSDPGADITLAGTTWVSAPSIDMLQTSIHFTSNNEATYTLSVNKVQGEEIKSKVEYTYIFHNPNLTLTAKNGDAPSLSGFIEENGGLYNTMRLAAMDDSIMLDLTKRADKSDTVWE